MKEVTRMYLRCGVLERWILLYIYIYIYIVANYKTCVSVKTLQTLKNYAVMLHLVSDVFPMLMLFT